MATKNKVFSSLKLLTVARLIAQISRWAATLLVIQQLSPADFGLAALATGVLSLLELFTSFGLNAAIIQSKIINKEKLRIIFGMIVVINLSLAAIMWMIAPIAADFYNQPELVGILRVLAFSFLFVIAGSLPTGLLVRSMRFKVIALSQVLSGIAGAVVSVYLAYSGFGYWAIIYGGLAIVGVSTLVDFIANPVMVWPIFSFPRAKQYLSFGSMIMGVIIVRHLYVNLDIIIAGKMWTQESLGIYAVALQLAVLPLNKIMPMIKQVAFPAYSKNQHDEEKVKGYMVKSMGLAMAISFPLFFGISSVAVLFVPVLLGETWQETAVPIMILCMIIPFRMMIELFEPALNAIGKPRTVFVNSLFILAVMTPTFYVSINFGVLGLCLGWLISFPLLSVISSYWYCREMNISFRLMMKSIQLPFLSSALMAALVNLLIFLLSGKIAIILLLVISVAFGVVIYSSLIFIFDRKLFDQYRSILTSR